MTRAKKAGGMAQEVEYLSSKHKAMSSNPSTAKTIFLKKNHGKGTWYLACNSNYSGSIDQGIMVQGQSGGKKVSETPSQQISWV
jgi:hypothetical protein